MALIEDVGSGPVGFEAGPLVYYVQDHPRFGPVVDPLFQRFDQGDLLGVASVVTLLEVLVYPHVRRRRDLAAAYRDILVDAEGIELCDVTPAVAERGAALRARYRLRTPDAIHLATAVEARATAFVTSDRRLRRVREVRVLVVQDYVGAKRG